MVLECTVSWTSLQKLSLSCSRLSDESMAKILSGCPILENLTLYDCWELKVLDLSKSLRLRTLDVNRTVTYLWPTQIVAPHIHCLGLFNSELSCTLVDISSLTEAKLEIALLPLNPDINADFLQVRVLEMLDKLKNVEKLTLGRNFIQILYLAEIRGVLFPILKVKTLTLDTKIFQYVIAETVTKLT
ncbi:hypothetical protein F2Q68_00017391 [Brassica cretica]|uniref:F-box/LRR-repeat protein 15/At3g58940/PEG3-like LRR domain-containing protein n=1 Tax=Brassica cretica TaxID=69181 RepID=A0A8S9HEF4_BRACR|nr:hypothetical protein F2Q68_00017391 [Brassica cretica]